MRRLLTFAAAALVATVLAGVPPELVRGPISKSVVKARNPPASPFSFSPEDVPGLLVWAEADGTMTESGGAVSSWGEPGYTALTQGTGGNQPAYTADHGDGLPAVTFDGSDFLSSASSISTDTSFAVFSAVNIDRTITSVIYEHGASADAGSGFFNASLTGVEDRTKVRVGATSYTKDYEELGDGAWSRERLAYDGNELRAYEEDVLRTLGSTTGSSPGAYSQGLTLYVGARGGSTLFVDGSYRYLLVYSPMPSAAEIEQIEAYLETKWSPAVSSPDDVANLLVWAEIDGSMTESGGDVSSWGETGGGLVALTQGDSGKQPTYDSAEGSIVFNGTSDILESASALAAGSSAAVFYGVRHEEGHGTQRFFDLETPAFDGYNAYFDDNGTDEVIAIAGNNSIEGNYRTQEYASTYSPGSWVQHRYVFDSALTYQFDGQNLSPATVGGTAPTDPSVTEKLYVGGLYSSPTYTHHLNGAFRYFLVYSPAPSALELTRIQNYLDNKYGDNATVNFPSEVEGLLVWAEADGTITESGGAVSSWGEPGYPALVQADGGKRPTWTADDGDGLPSISFDGGDALASESAISLGDTFVAFAGVKSGTVTEVFYELGPILNTTAGMYFIHVNNDMYTGVSNGTDLALNRYSEFTDGTWVKTRQEYSGTNASHLLYFDGALQSFLDETGTLDVDPTTTDTLYVGSRADSSVFLTGAYRYLLVYSPRPSDLEILKIENYLNNKWTP